MTTRTYYRSSVLAFPKTAEYGNAITRYKSPVSADSLILSLCAVAVVFVTVLLILEAL